MGEKKSYYQKLKSRIIKQYNKKKLIGDVVLSDTEYEYLLEDFHEKYKMIMLFPEHKINDIIFAVMLVQIGIKYYDGKYWIHVASELRMDKLPANQQCWIGESFTNTLEKTKKTIVDKNENVNNILFHAFVTNNYAGTLFEFLFAYYNLDLERDLSRNTTEALSALCDVIIKNDNTNRTYMILRQTADAVALNLKGSKVRIRYLLKLIDHCFWDDIDRIESSNRITQLFFKWRDESVNFSEEQNKTFGEKFEVRKKKLSAPTLYCNLHDNIFEIKLPSQLFKFEQMDECYWLIINKGKSSELSVECKETITGIKTTETCIRIMNEDIFSKYECELYYKNVRIKRYLLQAEDVRFFDKDGNCIRVDNISKGECFAYTTIENEVKTLGLIEKYQRGNLMFYSLYFEIGDIIKLPNEKIISIGNTSVEGLSIRGMIQGANAIGNDGKNVNVYKEVPPILSYIEKNKCQGTAICINNNIYRFSECDYWNISVDKKTNSEGYLIQLNQFEAICEGLNTVIIDVPNDRKLREYQFVYIKGFDYEFEDAPYIFQRRGTISFNSDYTIENEFLEKLEKNKYSFKIEESDMELLIKIIIDNKKIPICIPIPALFYSFSKFYWQIKKPDDIWHSELSQYIYLKYPVEKLNIYIGKYSSTEVSFHINVNREGVFQIDTTKFLSYINGSTIITAISIDDGNSEFDFLKIICRSFVSNSIFETDYENRKIIGKLNIVGKSKYFADVYYKDTLLAEKAPVENGIMEAQVEILSGKYTFKIYEVQDEFGFDEIYDEISVIEQELINPLELTNTAIKINHISQNLKMNGVILDIKEYDYYIGSLEKIDSHSYSGILIALFHHNIVIYANFIKVIFPDLNKVEEAYIIFIDEYGDECEYLYDSKKGCIVENEYKNCSRSEAYRRYEFSLYPEEFIYNVEFIEKNTCLEEQGITWIEKQKDISSNKSTIWKEKVNMEEESIDNLYLSFRSYNCLIRVGISTIGELVDYIKKNGLSKIRNLGRKNKEEIINKLDVNGYTFRNLL